MGDTLLTILLVLSVAATIFVVSMSLYLVVRKALALREERQKKMLFQHYSLLFAQLLSEEVSNNKTLQRARERFRYYETTIHSLKQQLQTFSSRTRSFHKTLLCSLFTEYTEMLKGEVTKRLTYYIYSLGLVDHLSHLLQSPHWWVRATAARDIGLLGARRGIVPLTAALEDEHPDVRLQAMNSLLKIVGVSALRNIFRLLPTLSQWQAVELSVIIKRYGRDALPYLLEAFALKNPSVVLFSLAMVGELGLLEAVDPLLEFCKTNPEPLFYATALESLGKLADSRALPVLLYGTQHGDRNVRLKALEALGALGAKQSKTVLALWVRQGDVEEKRIAARSLTRFGEEGIEALQQIARSADSLTRLLLEETFDVWKSESTV